MKHPSKDAYDFSDIPDRRNVSEEYRAAVLPDHVKQAIARQKAKKTTSAPPIVQSDRRS